MGLIIVVFLMVPAIIAAIVASIGFDIALRYGLFGRAANGTPPRVRKIFFSVVPISIVATYLALLATAIIPQEELLVLIVSAALAVLIVLGIKFASLRCAIRRERRSLREPVDNETPDPMIAATIAPAPHA